MNTGLLWYDSNPTHSIYEIVRAAAARYTEKFGQRPDCAYAHPATAGAVTSVDDITVHSAPNILRHHLWIGRETESR